MIQIIYVYTVLLDKLKKDDPSIRIQKYVEIPKEESVEDIFKRCHKYISYTATKAFQYKFLNDILVNNYWLKKWKISDSDIYGG